MFTSKVWFLWLCFFLFEAKAKGYRAQVIASEFQGSKWTSNFPRVLGVTERNGLYAAGVEIALWVSIKGTKNIQSTHWPSPLNWTQVLPYGLLNYHFQPIEFTRPSKVTNSWVYMWLVFSRRSTSASHAWSGQEYTIYIYIVFMQKNNNNIWFFSFIHT